MVLGHFFRKKKKRNSYDINMRRNKYYIDNCSTIKAVKKKFPSTSKK